MNNEFHEYRLEAMDRADKLCNTDGIKNQAYNKSGVDIRDYWKFHGLRDLAYEIYKKSLRIMSITGQDDITPEQMPESIEDSALDLINYAAFLYAEAKCRKLDSAGVKTNVQ